MKHDLHERTLALAGLFQSAAAVRHTARHGARLDEAVRASIHSLFQIDAPDVESVFGGLNGLRSGLQVLVTQLTSPGERDMELTRYVVALLFLERKLARQPDMIRTLRNGLEAAAAQAAYFEETHPAVIARLADLYQQTISTLTPRIMVSGEPRILDNPDNANLIRALLLAGIRAAVLWRQAGGSRWKLFIERRKLLEEARVLLGRTIEQ